MRQYFSNKFEITIILEKHMLPTRMFWTKVIFKHTEQNRYINFWTYRKIHFIRVIVYESSRRNYWVLRGNKFGVRVFLRRCSCSSRNLSSSSCFLIVFLAFVTLFLFLWVRPSSSGNASPSYGFQVLCDVVWQPFVSEILQVWTNIEILVPWPLSYFQLQL